MGEGMIVSYDGKPLVSGTTIRPDDRSSPARFGPAC